MNKLNWILPIIAVATIVGCIDEKSEFTVNPDGSGKVVYEVTFQPMNLNVMGTKSADPHKQLKEAVQNILRTSSGVDTWADISYKLTDDGRMYFKGAAFFPDINNLNLSVGGFSSDLKLSFARDQQGRITIEFKSEKPAEQQPGQTTGTARLSEAEVDAQVKQAKMQYQQSKVMMQSFFSALRIEKTFHLPGQIKEISNFTRLDDRTVRLIIEGAKLLKVMDEMMADEAWLKEQIRTGRSPGQGQGGFEEDILINEKLFGQKAPVRVVLAPPGGNLFDYKAEMASARKNFAGMLKDLGLEQATSLASTAPPASEAATELVIAKVRDVTFPQMYGRTERGYKLPLVSELPVEAIDVSQGEIQKAETQSGTSLLPKDEWQRKIHFPKLGKDKKTVEFDVHLARPDDKTQLLREVSGTLQYLTAKGSGEVDFGVMYFEPRARGKKPGISIRSIKPDELQKDRMVVGINVDLPQAAVKSARFYTEDGTQLDASRSGWESSAGITTVYFTVNGKLPQRGRIVLDVFQGLNKHVIAFKAADISLAEVGSGSRKTALKGGPSFEEQTITEAVPDYSTPVAVQLRDGIKKTRAGDLDGAIRIYLGVIANAQATERHKARAYQYSGMCYLKKGLKDEAVKQFEYVVANFPQQRRDVARARAELRKIELGRYEQKSRGSRRLSHKGALRETTGIRKEGKSTKAVAGGQELFHDDGGTSNVELAAVNGHAVLFEAPDDGSYLKAVRVYGAIAERTKSRKGNCHIWLCDENFKVLEDFSFRRELFVPYEARWVTIHVKPTKVPRKFVLCLTAIRSLDIGVDSANSGNSFYGLPGKELQPYSKGGDWLIRAIVGESADGAAR